MKVLKSSIQVPDKETLDRLIVRSFEEVCSLRLTFERKNVNNTYISKFIFASIQRIGDILSVMPKLSCRDIDCLHILMRSSLEVCVDLLWVFSLYEGNNLIGENLAKRFYQFGATAYLKVSQNYSKVFSQDLFLSKIADRYDHNKFVTEAQNLNIIDLVDKTANKKLQYLQSIDWRALPGLVSCKADITFNARSEIAAKFAEKLFRLKYAPYKQNWDVLNTSTHWSSLHMKLYDDEVANTFYLRDINASLGLLHDALNVGYDFLFIPPPTQIEMMRKEFCYFST